MEIWAKHLRAANSSEKPSFVQLAPECIGRFPWPCDDDPAGEHCAAHPLVSSD
jgi:hypothetical protein